MLNLSRGCLDAPLQSTELPMQSTLACKASSPLTRFNTQEPRMLRSLHM